MAVGRGSEPHGAAELKHGVPVERAFAQAAPHGTTMLEESVAPRARRGAIQLVLGVTRMEEPSGAAAMQQEVAAMATRTAAARGQRMSEEELRGGTAKAQQVPAVGQSPRVPHPAMRRRRLGR